MKFTGYCCRSGADLRLSSYDYAAPGTESVCFRANRLAVSRGHPSGVLDLHISGQSDNQQLDHVARQLDAGSPPVGVFARDERSSESTGALFTHRLCSRAERALNRAWSLSRFISAARRDRRVHNALRWLFTLKSYGFGVAAGVADGVAG